MDDVKFLNSRRRTCDSYPGCNGCELKGKPCPGYVTYNPIFATHDERVKPNENVVKKERAEKEMDAIEFLKEKERMCKACGSCLLCPAWLDDGCSINVRSGFAPEQQINIVKEWAAAHPRKTRQSVFLEQWPDTQLDKNGNVIICPKQLCRGEAFYKLIAACRGTNCNECRRKFWGKVVE